MKKTKVTTYSRSAKGWIKNDEDAFDIADFEGINEGFGMSLYKTKKSMLMDMDNVKPVKVKMTITVKVEPI